MNAHPGLVMADMNSACYFTNPPGCQNCPVTGLIPYDSEPLQDDAGILQWIQSVDGEETALFPSTTLPLDCTLEPGWASTPSFPTFNYNSSSPSTSSPPAISSTTLKGPRRATRRQTTHAFAEQRYRKRINEKIEHLSSLVPQHAISRDIEDAFGEPGTCSRVHKITSATAHISKLWTDYLELTKENQDLESRITQLQQLESCESCPLFKMALEIMQGSKK